MKGVLAYVLPKVVKAIGGVAVGMFVFLVFKSVYEPLYDRFINQISAISSFNDYQNMLASGLSYNWCDWVLLANAVLPLSELMVAFPLYFAITTTFRVCRFVFRVLDTWMAGVLALVK